MSFNEKVIAISSKMRHDRPTLLVVLPFMLWTNVGLQFLVMIFAFSMFEPGFNVLRDIIQGHFQTWHAPYPILFMGGVALGVFFALPELWKDFPSFEKDTGRDN